MALEDIKVFLYGLVIAIAIIGIGVFMMFSAKSMDSSLDPTNDLETFNASMNKAAEITDTVNDMQENINRLTSENVGALGWINALLGAAFNGLQAIGQSTTFAATAALSTGSFFGIPLWLTGLIVLLITILIAFAIYAAVTRQ